MAVPTQARKADLLFALTTLAACLAMYGPFVLGNLPVGADNILLYAPFFSLPWDGGPPLWTPYSLSGVPLVDNLQAALLYPLRWPFFFVSDWRDYFGLFNFLHYLAAIAGATALLRALGSSRMAALAGAIVFACGSHMTGRIINPTIFYACCWLPWLLTGATGRHAGRVWLGGLGLFMICTIGSPHLMFYGAVAYGLVFLLTHFFHGGMGGLDRGRWTSLARLVGLHAFCLAIGGLLALPTLLPGVQRSGESIRTETTIEGNLADSAAFGELHAIFFGGTGAAIHPEYIDKSCYAGPVVLVLLLSLLFRPGLWRDRRLTCGLVLLGAGVFFALGKHVGLQYIQPHVPGFNLLAGPARALVLSALGLGLLTSLALERPGRRTAFGLGGAALAAGLLVMGSVIRLTWTAATPEGAAPYTGEWLHAWLIAPGSLVRNTFILFDMATMLILTGVLSLLGALVLRQRPWLWAALLTGLIFFQMWHFAPRVRPPTEGRDAFNPAAPVAFLQRRQAESAGDPFRIAGYDPLRMHDTEFNNAFKSANLMPNMATLYRLEDIQGFDPLIFLRYLNLIEETAGRSPINDPIRNLDIARPDAELFDLLGVRYLIGDPLKRRLTTLPLTLQPGFPSGDVAIWSEKGTGEPVDGWGFVSLLDRALALPPGAAVARLTVQAEEGTFQFPVRNGIETADISAVNQPDLFLQPGFDPPGFDPPSFDPLINARWSRHEIVPSLAYRVQSANYRAWIDFGRPLHVKGVRWTLTQPGIIFNIASQAYRLAQPADFPWQRVHGASGSVTPVYEYTRATPRVFFLPSQESVGAAVTVPREILRASEPGASIDWETRRNHHMKLNVETGSEGLLVLREIWTPGWQAAVDGERAAVLPVNGLLRGVELAAGRHTVELVYRPLLPRMLFFTIYPAVAIGLAAVWFLGWRRRSGKRIQSPATP